jgi:mono/diheme cytochrome c family protein
MWDLANYVVSLARKPLWEMSADEVTAFYASRDADARANPVRRGHYLVDTMGCAVCHTPADEQFRALPGMYLAGGVRIRLEPFGDYPSGNLTSDRETGLGAWSDDDIARAITKGILKDGTRLLPYPMDYASFGTLRTEDVSAMVAYLRTVPPVRNKVPRPTRTLLPAYLWGKFRMLVLGGDPPMTFFAGNIGTATANR